MDQSGESADPQSAADLAADVVVFPAPPLVATVIVAAVPDVPPAALADLVDPVVDDGGWVVDWTFRHGGTYGAAELRAYREWRNSWERTWELGPLTNMMSLHRVVAGSTDVPRVAALLDALLAHLETVRIEASTVSDLLAQLDAVRSAIAGRGREGTAIVDQTPRRQSTAGFSRTWAAPAVPELLAANRETGVVVDPADGLVLVDRATGDRRIAHVVEADLRGEVVVVTNRGGETIELAAAAARPLAWIVPASVRWKARSIPEVVVWSSLFSRLPDALNVAATIDEVVSFTIDPFTIDPFTNDKDS